MGPDDNPVARDNHRHALDATDTEGQFQPSGIPQGRWLPIFVVYLAHNSSVPTIQQDRTGARLQGHSR
eukprot:66928-Amphidinium_carterae.2